MKSYRYQIKSKDEYTNFLSFLTDEGINFSSSFHHDGVCDDRFYITAYFNEDDLIDKTEAIAAYFRKSHTDAKNIESMNCKYANAQAAVDDLYVDTESLRLMLIDQIDARLDLNAVSAAEAQKAQKETDLLREEVKKLTDDKNFYMDRYFKVSKENSGIREQIQAFSVLLNSLFPKDE